MAQQALRVHESIVSGYYKPAPGYAVADWHQVQAGASATLHLQRLAGWEPYTDLYLVRTATRGSERKLYAVTAPEAP